MFTAALFMIAIAGNNHISSKSDWTKELWLHLYNEISSSKKGRTTDTQRVLMTLKCRPLSEGNQSQKTTYTHGLMPFIQYSGKSNKL